MEPKLLSLDEFNKILRDYEDKLGEQGCVTVQRCYRYPEYHPGDEIEYTFYRSFTDIDLHLNRITEVGLSETPGYSLVVRIENFKGSGLPPILTLPYGSIIRFRMEGGLLDASRYYITHSGIVLFQGLINRLTLDKETGDKLRGDKDWLF